MAGISPVSYTHLDVYKRQPPSCLRKTALPLKSPTGAFVASQTRTLRQQISSVLYRATSLEDFSDRLLQQYGIAVKESRGCLSLSLIHIFCLFIIYMCQSVRRKRKISYILTANK